MKRIPSSVFFTVCVLATSPSVVSGQVGNTSSVTYPGWIAADQVDPSITGNTAFDSLTGFWQYDYTVVNGTSAEQDILTFDLRFHEPPSLRDDVQATAPAGWWNGIHIPAAIPGAVFHAERSSEPPGTVWSPAAAQIPPGSSLSGFRLVSPYPPGYARTYVQGYAPLPFLTEEVDVDFFVPHDTTNSQRGWTLGPTLYTEIWTPGDDGLVADGFLAFMNIADDLTLLIDPAPIALKFSIFGETVFPETFQAKLNGTDVTAAFHPGASDGADRVGVFRLGSSPMVVGINVLETSIEGIQRTTQERMTDNDVVKFLIPTEATCTPQLSDLCR